MLTTLTIAEVTPRQDYLQAAVALRGEKKKKYNKKREWILGYEEWLLFRDWTKSWVGVWILFCLNQNCGLTLSTYGAPVASTSLCNSWPFIFSHNVYSIIRCTEVNLNSLSLLSFNYLHSCAFFKPLLRYDK